MDRILIVGLGGFIGSVLRYLVTGWAHAWLGDGFPWGTLTVNLVGCSILGALAALAFDGQVLEPNVRLFLFIGVLGGFTTFSAFGYETLALIQSGRFGAAVVSATAHLVLGLGAVWGGGTAVRIFLTK